MIAPAGSELDIEIELMLLVANGDARAFEELYDRLSGAAFSLAVRITGDHGAAADLTQEAFLNVWRNSDRYRPDRGSVKTWVLGILRNLAIDAYRRTQSRGGPPVEQDRTAEQSGADNTEDTVIVRVEAELVRSALQELPPEQLEVINLAYFHGLTQSEIAVRLAIPLGTVKGRVRLAMSHLQAALMHSAV